MLFHSKIHAKKLSSENAVKKCTKSAVQQITVNKKNQTEQTRELCTAEVLRNAILYFILVNNDAIIKIKNGEWNETNSLNVDGDF